MKKAIILSTFFIANIFSLSTFADKDCMKCALYARHQVDYQGKGDQLAPAGEHAAKVIGDLLANISNFNKLANQANQKANLPANINCCPFKQIYSQSTGKPIATAAIFAAKIGIPFSGKPGSPNLLPPTTAAGKNMGYKGMFQKNQMPKPTDGSIVIVLREETMNTLLPQLVNDGQNKAKIANIGQVLFPMMYLFYNLQGDNSYANLNLYLQKYTFPNVTDQCVTNLVKSHWGPKDLKSIDSLEADPKHEDVFNQKKCGTP